jgi:TPR repeat protein
MMLFLFACLDRSPPPPAAITASSPVCTDPSTCQADCDAGDALACNHAALFAHDGRAGVAQDRVEAARRYRRACELGAGIGCYNLQGQIRHADGVPEDLAEADALLARAHLLYERSCAAGGLTWCTNLAGLIQRGEGKPPDQGKARTLYADTCDRGDDLACVELASMMIDGHGGPHDVEGADALLRKTCEAGSGPACHNLALRTEDAGADGGPLYQKACAAGVMLACRAVALRLPEGAESLGLLRKACDAPVGMDAISCAVAAQRLVPTDPATSGSYLSRACSAGLKEGCLAAVELAADGRFPLSPIEGRALLERGCRLGDPAACAVLEAPPE